MTKKVSVEDRLEKLVGELTLAHAKLSVIEGILKDHDAYAKGTNDYTVQLNGRLRVLEEQRLQEKLANMNNDIVTLRDLVRSRDIKPKTKREGWINVYPGGSTSGTIDATEHAAKQHGGIGAIQVRISWEE